MFKPPGQSREFPWSSIYNIITIFVSDIQGQMNVFTIMYYAFVNCLLIITAWRWWCTCSQGHCPKGELP